MNSDRTHEVFGKDGLRGTIEDNSALLGAGATEVLVRFEGGRTARIPAAMLEQRDDGSFYVPLSAQDLETGVRDLEGTGDGQQTIVLPLIQEELAVRRQQVLKGGARVVKHVHEREEVVDEPVLTEQVDVERVTLNQMVDGPIEPRQEGDTLIIPLLEEVLVIEKRLMLREEVRVTRRRKEIRKGQTVTLRREDATIERMGEEQLASPGEEAGTSPAPRAGDNA